MPGTHTIERSSLSLPNSPRKTYPLGSRVSTQDEESSGNHSTNERSNQRRASDSPKKMKVSSRYLSATSAVSGSQKSTPRRSLTNDGTKQQLVNGLGNEKSFGHHNQQQRHSPSPPPPKPKCTLPTTVCQPGYVTPSKLFNMMGYGLENQYLFMHAHYLYLIDCRSREKFNASHITTGKTLVFLSFDTIFCLKWKKTT